MAVADQNLFSEHICSSSFQEDFKKHWDSEDNFNNAMFEIISKPFKICKISNFLKKDFLENLKKELTKCEFMFQCSDLYRFDKTDDFVNMSGNYIPALYNSFQSTLASWMECNTNIKLYKQISMSSACYRDTDHLLCHDDNMGDRRIAYILYLSENWTEQDGGTLDLFDTNYGAPDKIVKSLVPEYNSLVFFEVDRNNSYHQVSEVTTDDKCRLSINGWFYGPRDDYHKQPRYAIAKNLQEPNVAEVKLDSWIAEHYLLPKITKQIQKDVEKKSYTLLNDFLKKSTYQQIANDLTSQDIKWQMLGPADMHRYEVADETSLPESLKKFCALFKSISFFRLLEKYTGLDLVPKDSIANFNLRSPKMKLELQRWSAGCYSLLYDRNMLKEADISDKSIDTENKFLLNAAQFNDAATVLTSPSTTKAETTQSEVHQQCKRKRSELLSENVSPPSHKNKMIKISDIRSDIGQKCPISETLSSRTVTKSDRLEVKFASATGSSPHKSEPISYDAEVDIVDTTDIVSDSEGSEDISFVCYDSSSDESNDSNGRDGYALDVMIQFHTADDQGTQKTEDTINYVDPCEEEGTIIGIPQMDNHLCLVYKSPMVCRLHHYLNHFYDGYTYNIIGMYYE